MRCMFICFLVLFAPFSLLAQFYQPEKKSKQLDSLKRLESGYWSSGDVKNSLVVCQEIIFKYSDELTEREKATWYTKLGSSYFDLGSYILAAGYFKESLEHEDSALKSYTHSRIGSSFIRLGYLDSALVRYKMAVKFEGDVQKKMGHINSLGFVYFLDSNYSESRKNYEEALKYFDDQNGQIDSVQYFIIQSNLASLSFALDNKEDGFKHLEAILNSSYLEKNQWLALEVYYKCIQSHFRYGNKEKVIEFLNKLELILPKDPYNYSHLNLLKSKLDFANEWGTREDVDRYFNLFLERVNLIKLFERQRLNVVEDLQKSIFEYQLNLVSSNLKLKEESAEILKLSNGRLQRIFWVSFGLMIMIVFFFVIRFRQARLKRDLVTEKEKSTDLQIKMAEQKMENKKLELSKILASIDKNSSLSEEVLSRLSVLKEKDGDVKDDISQLIQFINSMSRTNSINELVDKNSDILGFGLKERIEARYTNLTASELQLIILIRIGLSTKEIAQLKNVEPSSVRIFKHRLKSKLEVSKDIELGTFVMKL